MTTSARMIELVDEMLRLAKKLDSGEATADEASRFCQLFNFHRGDIRSLADRFRDIDWDAAAAAEEELDVEGIDEAMTT